MMENVRIRISTVPLENLYEQGKTWVGLLSDNIIKNIICYVHS